MPPGTPGSAKVVQATGDLHNCIGQARGGVAELILSRARLCRRPADAGAALTAKRAAEAQVISCARFGLSCPVHPKVIFTRDRVVLPFVPSFHSIQPCEVL